MAKHEQSGLRYVFGGTFLLGMSKVIELRGDVAPYIAGGVSGERLFYHVLALLVLIGAAFCFFKGGRVAFGRIFRRNATEAEDLVKVFADLSPPRKDPADDESFDPDAALARYFARRPVKGPEPIGPTATPPRPAGGFGRKGL